MKYAKVILAMLILFVMAPSCKKTTNFTDNKVPIEIISKSSEKIDKSVGVIKEKSGEIQKETTQPEVKDKAVVIGNEADKIGEASKDIKGTVKKLEEAQGSIEALKKENEKLKETNQDLINESRRKTNYILGIIVASGVLALGASVFLFLIGMPKAAIGLGAASIVSSSAAVTVISMWDKIAWLGLGLGMLVVGLLVWQIVVAVKKIMGDKKIVETQRDEYVTALKETVTTVESIRMQLPEEVEMKIFGQNAIHGLAHRVQCPTTQKLIKMQKSGA
jgi:hypothetical protein